MKKVKFLVFILSLVFMPIIINADEIDFDQLELLSQTVKYYKTVSVHNSLVTINNITNNESSYTVEVTEDEYYNANTDINPTNYVETTYKKLTSSIYQNGTYYTYKAELEWKNIPSTRSYDIMGIGFYKNVKVVNNKIYFNQNYCLKDGKCDSTTLCSVQIFDGGVGASFKIPNDDLSSLNQTLYFNVTKNISATILSQLAAADYSHATKTITETNSQKYTVNQNGISLNGVSSYYDGIDTAHANWSGSW